MPVPGIKAAEKTFYDFAFFRDGNTLSFAAEKLGGAPGDSERIEVRSKS